MRTPVEIYEEYRIPPWLQLHQLRVAAVGKLTAESIPGVDVAAVIRACLLHDMGAIVKFDFTYTGSGLERLYEGRDVEYWKSVQKEMRAKYGDKEHPATDQILQEIGVSEAIRSLVNGSGLAKAQLILDTGPLELQILEYADQRVGLHGVVSLAERLSDMKVRYSPRWGKDSYIEREAQFDASARAVMQIEEVLQQQSSRPLAELSDSTVAPHIDELRTYEI